jgi:catalase
MDFSDDKLLQGRTFSYSDTQRYRVGPNYLQLPINAPKVKVNTNQRDGQMTYHVDSVAEGANPHVNYEPTSRGGPSEVPATAPAHEPEVHGRVVRQEISRTNNYGQAGERWRTFAAWEQDELISNLVSALKTCNQDIQERMVWHFSQADAEYGRRVADGLGIKVEHVPAVPAAVANRA